MPEDHFDAVIVGSGFGGSVMAYRLADAGLNVCLLERGKKYPPGSFPRSPREVKKSFWDPSEGLYGMFDVWSFDNFESLISSGLGGGSLIYANVLLRKDEKWFVREEVRGDGHEYWPVTRKDLEVHYDRVEEMMNVQKYPLEESPYDETPKTNAFREAARALDLDWDLAPLAVTFANEGERPVPGEPIHEPDGNLHGRTRTTCRLCGECDIGCNYGSKNTLDYNYLSAAQRRGADIRTLHEVRSFKPRFEGGYEIHYVVHESARSDAGEASPEPELRTMTADRLVLSAGTLGSSFLMLKNRDHFPAVSDRLGTRFCGNGDLLGFALGAKKSGGNGTGETSRTLDPNYGPVITSTIRMGDALDGNGATGRGFYLQDAGYPSFMSWLVESADIFSATKRFIRLLRRLITARLRDDTNLSAEMQHLIGGALSSSNLPLLGMGRDVPNGNMHVDSRGYLQCDWQMEKGSKAYFDRLKDTMEAVCGALNADFIINPTWLLKRVITVHPLGGCPMGRHIDEGVVNEYGEVFNYPGFYIADGSVMPGPVGPNPSLTIAAIADRAADHIIEEEKA
jgi:cholesterol oxidase